MIESILKIGSKLLVLVSVFGLIIAGFSIIPLPTIDLSPAVDFLNKIYSICSHWFPYFNVIWSFALTMLGLQITVWLLKPAILGYHWISSLWD